MNKAGVLEGEIAKKISKHADDIHTKKSQKAEKLAMRAEKRKLATDQEDESDGEPSLNALKNSKTAIKKTRFAAVAQIGKDARSFIQKSRSKAIEDMDSD